MVNFDKSIELFPVKKNVIFLNHCSISPTFFPGTIAEAECASRLSHWGNVGWSSFNVESVRRPLEKFLGVKEGTVSLIKSCTEGLNLIANGFDFRRNEEVLTYRHEYPANIYPWLNQSWRGVVTRFIEPAASIAERTLNHPLHIDNIVRHITPQTRIIALSHVQFTDGFRAEVEKLGEICERRGIFLIVDAAQALGVYPCYPPVSG